VEQVNRVCSDSVDDAIVAPDDLANIFAVELGDHATGRWELAKPFNQPDDSFSDKSCVAR